MVWRSCKSLWFFGVIFVFGVSFSMLFVVEFSWVGWWISVRRVFGFGVEG